MGTGSEMMGTGSKMMGMGSEMMEFEGERVEREGAAKWGSEGRIGLLRDSLLLIYAGCNRCKISEHP